MSLEESVVSTIKTIEKPQEATATSTTYVTKKTSKEQDKMCFTGKEVCLILLIIFTTYASYNSKANFDEGIPPAPFFRKNSLVGDFYKGELQDALLRAVEADVSFIMYYAPWDTESQDARRQFEAVARQHFSQVYFAGINCWQPRSNCKRNLNKIQQFPKFVVYITHETGVEYRGPVDSQYMSAFLKSTIRPLYRLNSQSELTRLRSAFDVVVVAFLNFNGSFGGAAYRTMYESALKYLEKDALQEVAFAVVTSSRTSMEMGIRETPKVRLYLWNETLEYNGRWLSDNLVNWVGSRLHQVSLWLTPPGIKSLTLAHYINQGPALILFTPFDNFVMYSLLREVALEYYNCKFNPDITQLASNISMYVSERIKQVQKAVLSCKSHVNDPTISLHFVGDANTSCGQNSLSCTACSQCGMKPFSQQNKLLSEADPLSAFSLAEELKQGVCYNLTPPPNRLPSTPLDSLVRGLACRYNRSISLLALDSRLYSHFAAGLGVKLVHVEDYTKAVLLNPLMESTHVLGAPITRSSLSQFLVDFTEGKLERLQRSQSASSRTQQTPAPSSSYITLTELNTDSFLPVAFNDSLNVAVLLHTRYCAFCHSVNHIYLSLAHLLRNVPFLLFTRIDGEVNDLPWHFTAPHYPSVLFFPAKRKAESRIFPAQVDLTLETLTNFVLANLPLELRLLAMVESCQRFTNVNALTLQRECFLDIHREVLEAISMQQACYHILLSAPNTKLKVAEMAVVLNRLKHMKRLQTSLIVDLQRTPHLTKLILHDLIKSSNSEFSTTAGKRIRDEL